MCRGDVLTILHRLYNHDSATCSRREAVLQRGGQTEEQRREPTRGDGKTLSGSSLTPTRGFQTLHLPNLTHMKYKYIKTLDYGNMDVRTSPGKLGRRREKVVGFSPQRDRRPEKSQGATARFYCPHRNSRKFPLTCSAAKEICDRTSGLRKNNLRFDRKSSVWRPKGIPAQQNHSTKHTHPIRE